MPSSRNVTADPVDPQERFALYRLCACVVCDGTGKDPDPVDGRLSMRCPDCRGEGRTRDLVATCATPEAIGTALYTLALEGEWDDGCPFGLLDRMAELQDIDEPLAWLIKPWRPSARNVSDAARTLAKHGRSST